MYVWERTGWPGFRWSDTTLLPLVADARKKQGRLLGALRHLGFDLRLEAEVGAVSEDVVRSAEIEGEVLDRAGVRSSVARRLGVSTAGLPVADRRTDGIVQMVLAAVTDLDRPLTAADLHGWQAALFPTGFSGTTPVRIGGWRNDAHGPMQVVSGPFGRERVHFQAPPATRVDAEMAAFLDWFARRDTAEGLLRAGLAHLWFVTIHPFDDGNGRLARALTDRALAQDEGTSQRFYSLSNEIRHEREAYYRILEATQRGDGDVTAWLAWFVGRVGVAAAAAEDVTAVTLTRARFWRTHTGELSDRQRRVLDQVLKGFEGHLTAKKWASMGKCSLATAQRDLLDLVECGLLVRNPGASKSTSYRLADGLS